jgi:hypothetical protein
MSNASTRKVETFPGDVISKYLRPTAHRYDPIRFVSSGLLKGMIYMHH